MFFCGKPQLVLVEIWFSKNINFIVTFQLLKSTENYFWLKQKYLVNKHLFLAPIASCLSTVPNIFYTVQNFKITFSNNLFSVVSSDQYIFSLRNTNFITYDVSHFYSFH